jgi:hypothetical protein
MWVCFRNTSTKITECVSDYSPRRVCLACGVHKLVLSGHLSQVLRNPQSQKLCICFVIHHDWQATITSGRINWY